LLVPSWYLWETCHLLRLVRDVSFVETCERRIVCWDLWETYRLLRLVREYRLLRRVRDVSFVETCERRIVCWDLWETYRLLRRVRDVSFVETCERRIVCWDLWETCRLLRRIFCWDVWETYNFFLNFLFSFFFNPKMNFYCADIFLWFLRKFEIAFLSSLVCCWKYSKCDVHFFFVFYPFRIILTMSFYIFKVTVFLSLR
jgi:predicted RNA-binding protein